MSQYVPGVIDYVPDIQPYQPDLNFFQQILQTKQAQYDVGYKKLSSLYGTLLNSPMLKNENIELRNKFFNDISANIRKISGMDLSVEQNVNAARKVFQPLIDNDYIMKDMAFTKKYQQALDRHEYFKNCLDEKNCGGKYWTDGLKYINYQAEDFVKSSLDESLSFQNPEYIPYTNAVQKAVQLAKDMDFKVNNITKSGGYNIITENGAVMVPDLTDFFMSNFSNDGNIRQVYDVLAYNKRKDYAKANAGNFGGSEEQAEMNYLDAMSGFISSTTEKEKMKALEKLDISKQKQRLGKQIVKQKGIDPDDPTDQGVVNQIQQSITDQLISQTTADFYDNTNQLVSSESFKDSDLYAKRNRIDAAMADSLFSADMMNAASNYANLTFKIKSYDADPFVLESIKAENARKLEDKKQKNRIDLAKAKGEIVEPSEEPAISDPAVPGSSFKIPDLYAKEETIDRQYQAKTAKAVEETVRQWDADIMGLINLPNGTRLSSDPNNRLEMSDDVRAELQRVREDVANKSETRKEERAVTENSLGDEIWTGIKSAGVWGWNYLTSGFDVAEADKASIEYSSSELSEERDVVGYETKDVTDRGFVDSNGNLGSMVNTPSFTNPESVNHYDKVFQRLQNVYSDPANSYFVSIVGKPSAAVQATAQQAVDQQMYEKAEKDRIAHNTAIIAGSFNNMDIDFSDYENPTYAKNMASKIVYGGNDKKYFMPKEQFIVQYIKNAPKSGQGMAGASSLSPMGSFAEHGTEYFTAEAEDIYDTYMERFKSEYNKADDATKPYADFRTWNPYGGSGGSNGQAHPYSIKGVDPRFPNTPGAANFKWLHTDLQRAMSDPAYADRLTVFNGDPGKVTDKDLNDYLEKGVAKDLMSILEMTRDDIRQGNKKEDAARFDIQILPVAANSPDYVAFKVRYSPKFIESHKGGENTEGYTKELFEDFNGEIGVIMPREAISKDNPAFSGLDRTLPDVLMDAYNEVNINAYSEYGGTAKIKRDGDHFIWNIRSKVWDPNANNFIDTDFSNGTSSTLTAGQIAQSANEILRKIYEKNYNEHKSNQGSGNKIYNVNDLLNQ